MADWTNPASLIVNAGSVGLVVLAVGVAWRSGREVQDARRSSTRAWWILVSLLTLVLGGYAIPLGATYVVIRYLRGGRSLVRGRLLTPVGVAARSAPAPEAPLT